MSATLTTDLKLWSLLRRRTAQGERDADRLTGLLAVVAFAATTAVLLVVVSGLLAFVHRAEAGVTAGAYSGEVYVVFALIATLLLLVPLTTLGAAAARLSMSRRDARLAALRLAGGTTRQVTTLTLLDAAAQSVTGALLGIGGYLVALPLVALLTFQGRPLTVAELWVGPGVLAGAVAAVLAVALGSAAASLRRVSISPLGVAANHARAGLQIGRLLALPVAVGIVVVCYQLLGSFGSVFALAFLGGFIAVGVATLNLIGPFVMQVVGRGSVRRARDAASLLAARRVLADPKGAWRSVAGVSIATVVAGLTSIICIFGRFPNLADDERVFLNDLVTGGLLTLLFAGVLAGVSTGVTQAGRVLDQQLQRRNLVLAGADLRQLGSAGLRETLIPLRAALGTATITSLALMVPLIGVNVLLVPEVIGLFVGSVAVATLLVVLGALAGRLVDRRLAVSR